MVATTTRARRRTWRAMERRSALGDPPAALVTGAGGGIGAAIATALGQLGWRLTLADIDEGRVGAVADALHARGVAVTTAVVDLSTIAGQAAAVDAATEAWGAVNLVAPFAGIFVEGAAEVDDDLHRFLRAVNLWHPLVCAELAMRRAAAAGQSCIAVMPLSDAGLDHRNPWPYARAKAELHARSGRLARRWRRTDGIWVLDAVVYPTRTRFGDHSDQVLEAALGELPAAHADHSSLERVLAAGERPEIVAFEIVDALRKGRRVVFLTPGHPARKAQAWFRAEVLGRGADLLPERVRRRWRIHSRVLEPAADEEPVELRAA